MRLTSRIRFLAAAVLVFTLCGLPAGLVPLGAAAPAPTPAAPATAKDQAAAAFEGFDAWVSAVMEEWKVPGLAVAATQDGTVVLSKGYGHRNREEKVPVTPDTLFAIGSNSKSFTAALLGMLVDDGKLDWDKPVREYLPDFRLHDPVATAEMTPRDLVTHRSGLPRHDLLWYASGLSREELYVRLRHLEPTRSFRSTFQYQNLMYLTAGYLAEQVTGRSWEELVRERILEPLDMERSNFSVTDMAKDENFAYAYNEHDEQVGRVPFRNIDAVGPAGSINSSVAEMIRYVQFLIDQGKVGDRQLLSELNARQMQTPQMVISGPLVARFADDPDLGDPSYGLGLMVNTYRGHKHVFHGGGIDGFISAMELLPRERIGVVVLSNTSGSGTVPTLVARNVFDRLLGLEPIDWAERSREREKKAREAEQEAKEKGAADRKEGTAPTHALADYAGSYEHPAYGVVEVAAQGERLTVHAAGFEPVPLEHYHYDIFAVPDELPPPQGNLSGSKVTFFYDKKGDIDRVALPLEPALGDIVFERLGDQAMRELEFLTKLAGEYELAGQVVAVALRGEDTLTLMVPGQPVYTLVPDRGTSFKLEGLDGFSVEFELPEGAEQASSVTFFQPNGTFVAARK